MLDTNKLEFSPSVSILVAGVLIAGAIVYTNAFPSQATGQPAGQVVAVAAANVSAPSADDHRFGSATAPTVLIEYSDFQCPFCSRVHPTLKRIVEESNGGIAWVYRHLPLESIHSEAKPAALASECVFEQLGNDGFWKFADALFADQSKMSSAYYAQVAGSLGANTVTFNACMASKKYASKIDAQTQEAMRSGGNGTPFTVVYGKGKQEPVSGALPYEQFMAVINSL